MTETQSKLIAFSDRSFSKITKAIDSAETLEQLLGCVPAIVPNLIATYHHFGSVGAFDYNGSSEFYSHNVPEDIKTYLENHKAYESNPGVVAVLSKGATMWLSELFDDPYIIEKKHVPLAKATMELTGDALCLPLYGPNNRSGYMFVAFGLGKAECDEFFAFRVQGIAQKIHVRYCIMLEKLNKQVKLTPRESQVLELITFGKSNSEIATILDISSSTVSGYVECIFLKLDVSDRVTAALRAQSLKVAI